MSEPVRMRCEGSGCPLNNYGHALGSCAMCGAMVVHGGDGIAWPHERDDVLAMLDRGDFTDPPRSGRNAEPGG